ncbi:hypothetical protein C7447_101614 [Tenacibaculum adriaticum]|uniref:TspO/MBR related protein n=2 Tax=Tenacibaculum adriaticum TaxID=413713 RepID=A0A5S5DW00_9FLAO|nr:hypothetical protein C7447_101614 [Tenacibaculum adriaticum]
MNKMSISKQNLWIKIIASVNGVAAVIHAFFWVLVFVKSPTISSKENILEKTNLATTYGFGIADLIWSVPLLVIGSVWLWKKTPIGWLGAQFANVLYWYSFTVIITRDFHSGTISPGTMLFLPFAIFSFWAASFLWKQRSVFF